MIMIIERVVVECKVPMAPERDFDHRLSQLETPLVPAMPITCIPVRSSSLRAAPCPRNNVLHRRDV